MAIDEKTIQKVSKAWIQDALFRQRLRQQPQQALQALGIPITEEIENRLKRVPWDLSDQELTERLQQRDSKHGGGC